MNNITQLLGSQTDFEKVGYAKFLLAMLISLLMGISYFYVYRLYFRENEPQDGSLARSLPLISPAVTVIFWLIQFSLPLSLGLLGAMSFVRFRSPIKRAEDIAFILLVIAGALGCAVSHFVPAFSLLIVVLIYSIVRNQWGGRLGRTKKRAILTISTRGEMDANSIGQLLRKKVKHAHVISSTFDDDIQSIVYDLWQIAENDASAIKDMIRERNSTARIDIFYPSSRLEA